MPIGLEHHFQRESHVQQPDPPAGIPRINARGLGRTLFQ